MPQAIDDRIYELYDDYCHSGMERREFLRRAAAFGGLATALSMLPDYARASQVAADDARIVAEYLNYPSPGGNAEDMRGYLVRPKGEGKFGTVVVIHENRGRNPYIEDVTRRLAIAGYMALAPDALWAVGGYPGDDEQGKALQAKLDRGKILVDMENAARFVRGTTIRRPGLPRRPPIWRGCAPWSCSALPWPDPGAPARCAPSASFRGRLRLRQRGSPDPGDLRMR